MVPKMSHLTNKLVSGWLSFIHLHIFIQLEQEESLMLTVGLNRVIIVSKKKINNLKNMKPAVNIKVQLIILSHR